MESTHPISDTSPEAATVLLRLARELPARQKLASAVGMSLALRRLAEAGVRSRHPEAGEEEIRKRLAAVILPRNLAIAVFGWDPDEEGY